MSTTKYNLKNPGVKRIMQEARELAKESKYEYDAHPLEDNIFEWHFTVRGPKDTDFEEGRYHGRIILPSEYPFKPPEIIFLTPNGRFELNTKICLSITGFHPEFWQPAWGIRTVLLAVIGFFPTEARGAIGGLDYTKEERRRLAKKSIGWVCPVCQVNTKDALSDTPPDIPAGEKEILPNFMITYKTPDNVNGESSGNSTTVDKIVSEDGESGSAENKSAGNGSAENVSDKNTLKDTTENSETKVIKETTDNGILAEGTNSTLNEDASSSLSTQETLVVQDATQTISAERAKSPIWLDALIGGLLSVLIGLICRKYRPFF